jgi:hypothetical protein
MAREVEEPTIVKRDEKWGDEWAHPAWAMIGASRVSGGDAVLFDSDIRHNHYVVVRLRGATRRRSLHRDSLFAESRAPIVEVAMSEAQWASFVSSMNVGDGVACTLRYREGQSIPGLPYESRLKESVDEVRGAADKALERVREAFAKVEEKPNKGNIRALRFAIEGMPNNMAFAAESLTEHTENVVQKARADIEAMVVSKAQQLGLEPGDLGVDRPALAAGDHETGEEA